MLKKIRVGQVRLDMHLHELCGGWMEHPFWKTSFVLREPSDLKKLQASAVCDCIIDVAKGLDVAVYSPELPAAPTAPPPRASAQPALTTSLREEVRRAAALVNQSREAVESLFNEARMGRALDTGGCLELVNEVASSVWRNPGAMVSLARLKTHDDCTYLHSVAVCALMISLARKLGMDEAQAREAGMAGLLHDMGKAALPLAPRAPRRPGRPARPGRRRHRHVRSHGCGLRRVRRDHVQPPVQGRLGPGRIGGAHGLVAQGPVRRRGVPGLRQKPRIYPTGSLVRMQSGRLAVVTEQHPGSMTAPKVRVFFSTKSNMPVPLEVLDLSLSSCSDRITGRESNSDWKFPHLEALWVDAEVLKKMRQRT